MVTNKLKLAICMEEGDYLKRLSSCLMKHYGSGMEIHLYTGCNEMEGIRFEGLDCVLMEENFMAQEEMSREIGNKLLILTEKASADTEEEPFIWKYQSIPDMVEQIQKTAGRGGGKAPSRGKKDPMIYGIYSLGAPHMQLPFGKTIGGILGETKKVLLLDLQENSGLETREDGLGLEDLLAMVSAGTYSQKRIKESVGHMENWDYVSPVTNSECICESTLDLYRGVWRLLAEEMGYEIILCNLGSRFQGFFRLFQEMEKCFFLEKSGYKSKREGSFYKELGNYKDKILVVSVDLDEGEDSMNQQWMRKEVQEQVRQLLN